MDLDNIFITNNMKEYQSDSDYISSDENYKPKQKIIIPTVIPIIPVVIPTVIPIIPAVIPAQQRIVNPRLLRRIR